MKKGLCCALLMLGITAPALAGSPPSVTLYGNFRYSLNQINEDRGTVGIDGLQGRDNVSLFGLKGQWGRQDLKVFFHLQTQAFADGDPGGRAFKQRFYYGGLKGRFGQISIGRMTNTYKAPGFAMDPFYNYSHIAVTGFYGAGGGTYGLSGGTNGFTDNAIQYESPLFRGLKLTGGVIVDDSNENGHGYLLGGSYQQSGFTVGLVAALHHETMATLPGIPLDGTALRAYLSGKVGSLKLGLSYETLEMANENMGYLFATATARLESFQSDLSIAIGRVSGGAAEGLGVTAGLFKTLLTGTQVFALFSVVSLENDRRPSVFSLGLNTNFRFTLNP